MIDHTHPSFYATLASLGEATLMNALDALDDKRRIAGFDAFMTMVEEEGVPVPFFEENQPIATVQAVGEEGDPKREMEHGQTTFARLIAQAMGTKPADDAERAAQAEWIPRLRKAMGSKKKRQHLLDCTLFEYCSQGNGSDLLVNLVAAGADPNKTRTSKNKDIRTSLTCFGEAVAYGRLDKAIALMRLTGPEEVIKTARHIADGHAAPLGERDQRFVEGARLGRMLDRQPELVLEFLDQLDKVCGAEKSRGARASALKGYLNHCHAFARPWHSNTLELLCTEHSPSSPSSLWKDFYDLFESGVTVPAWKLAPWMEMARKAVCVGCYPVLKPLSPMIQQQSKQGVCTELEIGKSMQEPPAGSVYVAEQFKATMQELAAQGISMNQTGHGVPMVHSVALAGSTRLSRLSILLELGMDPHALKADQTSALDCIQDPDVRERWEWLVRSFDARKTTRSLLDEIESPSP